MRYFFKTLIVLCLFSCDKENGATQPARIFGTWSQLSDFNLARSGAVSFVISDSAYIFGGVVKSGDSVVTFKDLYVWNKNNNTWSQRASLPEAGRARQGAAAFVVNGKAFVGLGLAEDQTTHLKDFWSYDPLTNQWSRVADFISDIRTGAVAFAIGINGYVGGGENENGGFLDFYRYDVALNTWQRGPNIPQIERAYPFVFVIGGKAYVGGGTNNGALDWDFVEFDPSKGVTGEWTMKNDLIDDTNDDDPFDAGYTIACQQGATFVIDGKGYLASGRSNDFWQYVPAEDRWYKMKSFTGNKRSGAVGYTSGNYGYFATGMSSESTFFKDVWRFDPQGMN